MLTGQAMNKGNPEIYSQWSDGHFVNSADVQMIYQGANTDGFGNDRSQFTDGKHASGISKLSTQTARLSKVIGTLEAHLAQLTALVDAIDGAPSKTLVSKEADLESAMGMIGFGRINELKVKIDQASEISDKFAPLAARLRALVG